jgi:regulator of protease activity HflC (stomatin/prohibitin superfamily)
MEIVWIILAVFAIIVLFSSLKIVQEYERGVIFFLGRVTGVRGPGLIILIPFFETMTRVSLRTVTMEIPSQKIITKDNVSIDISGVCYFKIVDPQKSVVAIENVFEAINQIAQTTMRNIIGQFQLDQVLSSTASINEKIKEVIDNHTEPWGVQVTAVEIKDITLPDNMQRAMAKEAEADRERRAKIIAADGEFQAAAKLGEAADVISDHPIALQLRTLQTMAEISTEKNSTIIFPAQFMTNLREVLQTVAADSSKK